MAATRLAGARQPDRFEAQDLVFFERVREMYLARMAQQPERFVLIQADQPQDAVARAIGQALSARGVA